MTSFSYDGQNLMDADSCRETNKYNHLSCFVSQFQPPMRTFLCLDDAELANIFNSFVAFLIYGILSIELSVLSQFQIPLKLRRRVIIARIIRSGYNLIKAWKRLASAKTLQTHFNNRIIYSQKWYFTTSKLLRSTIPKMNHFTTQSRKEPQNESTNNCSITLHANKIHNNLSQKKTNTMALPKIRRANRFSLISHSMSGSLSAGALGRENPVALYINDENNLENARTNSREQQKKSITSYANRLSKFFEEGRIAGPI